MTNCSHDIVNLVYKWCYLIVKQLSISFHLAMTVCEPWTNAPQYIFCQLCLSSLALYFHRNVPLFYHNFWWNNHYDIVFIIIIILGQHIVMYILICRCRRIILLAQSGTFPNYVLIFENNHILMIKNYHFKTWASLEAVVLWQLVVYMDICALLDLFYKDYYLQMFFL